jgi:protein FAM50
MTLDELKAHTKRLEDARERKIAEANAPIVPKKRAKKKKRAKNALSFDDEEEGDDGAPDDKDAPPKKKTKAEGDEKEGNFLVRRLVKNPDVDTSFLPDVDREEREVTPGIIVTIRMTLIQ